MRLGAPCLQRRLAGRFLLVALYILTVWVLLLQTGPVLTSVLNTVSGSMAVPADGASDTRLLLQRGHAGSQPTSAKVVPRDEVKDERWFNPPNCSALDFLAGPDPSARAQYDEAIFCGPQARSKDVFCRMFYSQVGLHEDPGDCDRESDDTKVPRIVYYVIFGDYKFKFWHYVSVKAAKRYANPSAIYVIADAHPLGYWWQRVLREVKGVRFIHRERPGNVASMRVRHKTHLSDVVRLQALLLNGGIYLDADMIVLRSLEPILEHNITMGLIENGTGMGNGFIAAKRNSDFVREWYDNYNRYNDAEYYKNSLHVPRDMWHRQPHRLHMESERLYRPNWFEADLLFKRGDFDWSQNYAVHVWTNGNPVPRTEREIQAANTTIAQIFRHVLYGDSRPRSGPVEIAPPGAA